MEIEDVRDMLKKEIAAAGSQKLWARSKGLSQSYVSDVLLGRKEPGAAMLTALGVERVVSYRRVRGGADGR